MKEKIFTLLTFILCISLWGQDKKQYETATFAGGCFWCVEADFDKVKGVVSTTSGYIGGDTPHPTYDQVSSGKTGHVEAVEIVYNPKQVSYEHLLDVYWKNIDPTTNKGQFCDKGSQYRPIIFYHNEQQKELAEASKQKIVEERKVRPVLVEIRPATTFYPAEKSHQDYYQKKPLRYKFYRITCGRDKRLKQLWGKS